MTADITIEPEEGIERFRYLINTRSEFDYTAFEGEASVRRMIIGEWDNFTNESTKAITVNATGLKPNTEYQVGIVGFDKELREKFLLYDFTTGEPTGPKPTLAVETQTVETPWNKAAFKVNATYAVAMTAGVSRRAPSTKCSAAPVMRILRPAMSFTTTVRSLPNRRWLRL